MDYQYIDDLYLDFFRKFLSGDVSLTQKDEGAAENFYQLLANGEPLTKLQGLYVIRILKNHRDLLHRINADHYDLDQLPFKNQFRIKDTTKQVDVELDDHQNIWIVVKQPFEFKDRFDEACLKRKKNSSFEIQWDNQKKIKKYLFETVNCIMIKDFCDRNHYAMTEKFLNLVEAIEIIWNDQDLYLKKCQITDKGVELINAAETAEKYFLENKTGSINDDLLLAKSIGHDLDTVFNASAIEKICSSKNRFFWVKDLDAAVALFTSIDSKICLLITREQMGSWLSNFIDICCKNNINRSEIKIGFRTSNQEKPDFNQWIKENGHGGNLEDGKILIFKEKPPKWLIEKPGYVKIVATTESFVPSSAVIQDWIAHQTCTVFLGSIKPTSFREKEIDLL
jgi:hypothetical protein